METTMKSNVASIFIKRDNAKEQAATSDFWKNAEANRFGICPMLLLVIGIIGGVAAASGIMDSWVKLAAVAFSSTICLALILAVAPMRTIVIGSSIAVFIDLLVIIF